MGVGAQFETELYGGELLDHREGERVGQQPTVAVVGPHVADHVDPALAYKEVQGDHTGHVGVVDHGQLIGREDRQQAPLAVLLRTQQLQDPVER